MTRLLSLTVTFMFITAIALTQNIAINNDGTAPNPSAMLDIKSTTKGFLLPRMSTIQRMAIASPAEGLLVYDIDTKEYWYHNGTAWLNTNKGWNLTGNAGTNPALNFIGTTDASPLFFKTRNVYSGFIDSAKSSVAFGFKALTKLSETGETNTAVGHMAMHGTTDAKANTAVGYNSLFANITGGENTAIGFNAMSNATGSENTAVGSGALNDNAATGNTALGFAASYRNTTGINNTSAGYNSLFQNLAGSRNTATGYGALYSNTVSDNTALGSFALVTNSTGTGNTAVGSEALRLNFSGHNNTAIGFDAGKLLPDNVSNVTCVGYGAGFGTTLTNHINIGNMSVTWIGGQTGWFTYSSDARIKRNVQENIPGLDFITKLKPVTYNLDIREQDRIMNPGKAAGDKEELWEGKYDIEKMTISGFLAQDVEKAASELGYDFSGVYKPKDGKGLYGLQYSAFVMPLVKSVQELLAMVEELKKENVELRRKVDALKP